MAPSCRLAVNIICVYLSTNKLVCAKDSFFVSNNNIFLLLLHGYELLLSIFIPAHSTFFFNFSNAALIFAAISFLRSSRKSS